VTAMAPTPFDFQPTLHGRLIEIRPLREDDFDALAAAASDPLIWEQHPEPDRYRRQVFQKFFDGAIRSKGAFSVIHLESRRVIGSSRFYDYKPEAGQIAIGYTFLEREFWGQGYGPELKKLMLDHAFRFVDEVFFEVGEANVRSQVALQRLGARIVKKFELGGLDGNIIPAVLFVITQPDWARFIKQDWT